MSDLKAGNSILAAQTSTSIGAENGIKTIAAVHCECRLWVISEQTAPDQIPTYVRYCPLADKLLRRRDCPFCAKSRQARPGHILHRVGLKNDLIGYAQMGECHIDVSQIGSPEI